MKSKFFLLVLIGVAVVSIAFTQAILVMLTKVHTPTTLQTIGVHEVGSTILASGNIHSQNEATLHFQTGGKLIFLPVGQGDTVYQGQTIAQLDTYALQRQLTQALNTYRSTRDTFDQTQANAGSGVLRGNQTSALNPNNMTPIGGTAEDTAINDAIKRIVDQNQANLDNSVINVELANYALQLSTLTAPFTGVITNEDVTVAGQNITPVTSFSLEDPTALVFRATVAATDIDYVTEGATATIHLAGYTTPLSGVVVKIYPQKTTLPTGEDVYQVDIQSAQLQQVAKYGQTGNALITSSAQGATVTVPTWVLMGHNHLWVGEHGKLVFKTVTIGKTHGSMTEVLSGLTSDDQVITNSKSIAAHTYSLL